MICLILLNKFRKNILFYFFFILFLFIKNENLLSINIEVLAKVDNIIISSEDLKKEKIILNYLYNNKVNNINLNQLALKNLIDQSIKELEILKNNSLISKEETEKYLKIVLENNSKSLEDFRQSTKSKVIENYFKKKIQIEISWNKLVMDKFIKLININMDEILAVNKNKTNNNEDLNKQILKEKNKKLESLSETYFNEIKSQTLIKYQ